MRTATLEIDRTCPCCWKFRLRDAAGRVVWSNRVMPDPRGEAGARTRMAAWCERYGWRVIEPKQKQRA